MRRFLVLVIFAILLPMPSFAEGEPCGVVKMQNGGCAIVQNGADFLLLEWAGKGFFHDGHKVCGEISTTELAFPQTVRDTDYKKDMRVRFLKKAAAIDSLQAAYDQCGKKE